MKKPITIALLRSLEKQLNAGEISYSRMVEILNEKAFEAYRDVCELSEWDGGDETSLCDCGKGEGICKRKIDESYMTPASEGQFEKAPKVGLDEIETRFNDFKMDQVDADKIIEFRGGIHNLISRPTSGIDLINQEIDNLKKRVEQLENKGILKTTFDASIIQVGHKSKNLTLKPFEIKVNIGGDPNRVELSDSNLVHYEFRVEGIGNVWEITNRAYFNLNPDSNYYIYARCLKTQLIGHWFLSKGLIENQDDFYYFPIGILYPVQNGVRGHEINVRAYYSNES